MNCLSTLLALLYVFAGEGSPTLLTFISPSFLLSVTYSVSLTKFPVSSNTSLNFFYFCFISGIWLYLEEITSPEVILSEHKFSSHISGSRGRGGVCFTLHCLLQEFLLLFPLKFRPHSQLMLLENIICYLFLCLSLHFLDTLTSELLSSFPQFLLPLFWLIHHLSSTWILIQQYWLCKSFGPSSTMRLLPTYVSHSL